jgi:hypothetical protein
LCDAILVVGRTPYPSGGEAVDHEGSHPFASKYTGVVVLGCTAHTSARIDDDGRRNSPFSLGAVEDRIDAILPESRGAFGPARGKLDPAGKLPRLVFGCSWRNSGNDNAKENPE